LSCFNSCSQAQDAISFIKKYFGANAKLVYTDRLNTYYIDGIKSALSKDTLYGHDSSEILIVTPQERIHIGQALTKLTSNQWSSSLFKYGRLISQDTVRAIFKDREHRGWQYFKQHYGAELHEFSNPIFIRDNTLCIFYSGYSCGYECGEGELAIFKKQKEDWVLWMKLYVWLS
jgi:hypothetical protein